MFKLHTLLYDFTGSLRSMADVGLSLLQNRLELLSLEIKEEANRFVCLLLLALFAVVLALFTLILGTAAVIYALSPEHRLIGLIIAAAVFGLSALVLFAKLNRKMKDHKPFAQSIAELKKDRERLK